MIKNLLSIFLLFISYTAIAQYECLKDFYAVELICRQHEDKGDKAFLMVQPDSAVFYYNTALEDLKQYQSFCSIAINHINIKKASVQAMQKGVALMQQCQYDSARIWFNQVKNLKLNERNTNYFKLSRSLSVAKQLRETSKTREALDSLRNIHLLADTLSICIKTFKKQLEIDVEDINNALESAKAAYNIGDFDKAAERITLVKTETAEITLLRQKIQSAKQVRLLITQNNYVEAQRLLNTLPTDDRLALEAKDLEIQKQAYIQRQLESIKPLVEVKRFAEANAILDTTYLYTGTEQVQTEKIKLVAFETVMTTLERINFKKDCNFNFDNELPIIEENKDRYRLASTKLNEVKNVQANPFHYNKYYADALNFIQARQYIPADTCFAAIEKHCGRNETIQNWKNNIAQLRIANDSILQRKAGGAIKILTPLAKIKELHPTVNIMLANVYLKHGKYQDLRKPDSLMAMSNTRKAYPEDKNGDLRYTTEKATVKQAVQDELVNSGVYFCATGGIYSPVISRADNNLFLGAQSPQLAGYPVYYGGRLHFHGNRVANFYIEGRYQSIGLTLKDTATNFKTTYTSTFIELPAVLNLHTTRYKKGKMSKNGKRIEGFHFCFPIGVVSRVLLNKDTAPTTLVKATDFAAGATGGLGIEFAGGSGYFGLQGMFTQYLMPTHTYNNTNLSYSYWNVGMTVGLRL